MHAETKKNPSRETCNSSSAAPELTLAAAGAKNRSTCVLSTPACFIGRMASTWSSRWRGISTPSADHGPVRIEGGQRHLGLPPLTRASVHEAGIVVLLELEHVVRGIGEEDLAVFLGHALEAHRRASQHG